VVLLTWLGQTAHLKSIPACRDIWHIQIIFERNQIWKIYTNSSRSPLCTCAVYERWARRCLQNQHTKINFSYPVDLAENTNEINWCCGRPSKQKTEIIELMDNGSDCILFKIQVKILSFDVL